ncbi:hypothetical protein PVAND_005496 [Polypedilum vanderplanki]|uniref:Enoyl-CoA delta isomerase 1, mitochondrial n=1 Tax=Polypedilum vanderplanki TaxID=319348 RepID=A0A9J6C0D1_POLVA|nr:hypothetical protein PVAND_005496 [Polypedilum vanderplanki]
MNSTCLQKTTRILNKNVFKCFLNSHIRNQSSATNQSLILTDVNDKTGFATVAFNRPPMSNFTLELLQDFSKSLDEVESKNYKGMILTSTSPTVFSAGLDLKELLNPEPARLKALRTAYIDCCIKLYSSMYPTVAAINGHAIGGGCFIAMACEYRIMLPNSKIGLNETQLGIAIPEVAVHATRNIISSRDAEMALTLGSVFTTDEALKIGLIDEVAENKEDALAKSEKFLSLFKKIPKRARGITKQFFRKKVIDLMTNNREKDVEAFVSYVMNPASQKSFQAFLDEAKNKK